MFIALIQNWLRLRINRKNKRIIDERLRKGVY